MYTGIALGLVVIVPYSSYIRIIFFTRIPLSDKLCMYGKCIQLKNRMGKISMKILIKTASRTESPSCILQTGFGLLYNKTVFPWKGTTT